MTLTVTFQRITKAEPFERDSFNDFSIVTVFGKASNECVQLFLPKGKAQAVADAINAALVEDGQ